MSFRLAGEVANIGKSGDTMSPNFHLKARNVPKALVPHHAMNVGLPEADLDVQPGNYRIVAGPSPFILLYCFRRIE